MSRYVFPVIMIVLDVCAAAVYAWHKDARMVIYWIAAAVINAAVTFGK